MNSKDPKDYQDVLTFKQQEVRVLKDVEIINKLYDPTLEPIIIVLRSGPLTIKELVKEYNKIAEEPKSEMTIYRYIKDLDKLGIVTEIGKRIKKGQSATETLYGRTAKIFWNLPDEEDYWKLDKSKKYLEPLLQLMSLYKGGSKISNNNLRDLLSLTHKITTEEVAEFLDQNNEAISGIFSGLSFKDVDKIITYFSNLILLMKKDSFTKELEKCGC
ncbi:MAG: hypothetical protein GOP50_12370 [Candidatus Heimdallarchaeota archaeon]|nr:hypothetical protein [Candidatus Heimdallarchaeota archaeon]